MRQYKWFQISCLIFLALALAYVRLVPAEVEAESEIHFADCPIGYTPTYTIQGTGDTTPIEGQTVTTCGVVVGVSQSLRGIFVQDVNGDDDTATSDGLFVYRSSGVSGIAEGDLVAVYGRVSEYYGCTEIVGYSVNVLEHGLSLPEPVSITLPMTRTVADVYLEQHEGMLVNIPVTATVVGPTNYYGETYIIRGDTGVSRIVMQDNFNQDGYRIGLDDGVLVPPDLKVGDVISNVHGPLHFTFDNWKVEQSVPLTIVESVPLPGLPSYGTGDGQFSLGAFNVLNLDADSSATKLLKVVGDIGAIGGPTFLALSEVATNECPDDNVMPQLLALLSFADIGDYQYFASHPDVGCHGVALLYREDDVIVNGWTTLQDCSPVGSSSSDYDALWSTCQSRGEYPLFSRRPVVVTATLSYDEIDTQVVVIALHLKSKGGSSTCGDPECDDRRLEQAQLVASYVVGLDSENVVVLGDFNDYMDSLPLQVLYSSGLTSTFTLLPANERYSYIYEGVSQAIDNVLVSHGMLNMVNSFVPVHVNVDYPYGFEGDGMIAQRASDHDPLLAVFDLPVRDRLFLPVVLKE